MSNWIPVTERLPESFEQRNWAAFKCGAIDIVYYDDESVTWAWDEDFNVRVRDPQNILAWMPIETPEPYKP